MFLHWFMSLYDEAQTPISTSLYCFVTTWQQEAPKPAVILARRGFEIRHAKTLPYRISRSQPESAPSQLWLLWLWL